MHRFLMSSGAIWRRRARGPLCRLFTPNPVESYIDVVVHPFPIRRDTIRKVALSEAIPGFWIALSAD
jgi:hypothetical protein